MLWGVFDFLDKGGWVAYVLAVLSLILWYALGFRYFILKSQYLKKNPKALLKTKNPSTDDVLGSVVVELQSIIKANLKDAESAIKELSVRFSMELNIHRQTIKSIVIVAPLLGLLGTVIGMIETFSSLQDSSLFSQSGGIAGGISQALITTQMGLVVAIPGLLVGRKLDKQQDEIENYVDQVKSLLVTERLEA